MKQWAVIHDPYQAEITAPWFQHKGDSYYQGKDIAKPRVVIEKMGQNFFKIGCLTLCVSEDAAKVLATRMSMEKSADVIGIVAVFLPPDPKVQNMVNHNERSSL